VVKREVRGGDHPNVEEASALRKTCFRKKYHSEGGAAGE